MTQALDRLQIGILADPNCFVPDIIGVYTVFCDSPNCDIHFLWKHTNPQKNPESFFGIVHPFPIHATTTFADCPQNLDVLCVGASTPNLWSDEETLAFLADRGGRAKYIIGICGGSFTLAAAGLLTGYWATTNFQAIEALAAFGAIPVVSGGHVVVDRNRFTAGPVTGSFEAGLMVLAQLRGEEAAKEAELTMEYVPHPPFGTGSPELAGPELTQKLMQRYEPFENQVRPMLQKAAERLMMTKT